MPKKQRNKNSQAEKYDHMLPKNPATDVRSERSAMLIQHNKVKKSNIGKKKRNSCVMTRTVKLKVSGDHGSQIVLCGQ